MGDNSIKNKNVTRPYKGIWLDSSPLDQPKGTYTMAWNAINETIDGHSNFISNEKSNNVCTVLPEGYRPIGDVYITDSKVVIFSTNNVLSEIGILDTDTCEYTTQVNTECLGFSLNNQIDVIYRLRRGCNRTLYWVDGNNPVRYFNLDSPNDFQDSMGNWDCKLFNLFLGYSVPCFDNVEVIEQGSLASGGYHFAIQYLDADLNPTRWIYVSQKVPIFDSLLNTSYRNIIGSSNEGSDSLGFTTPTNKAIRITLSDLDESYSFYRYAAIAVDGFNNLPTRVLVSPEIPLNQTEFVFNGNIEGFTEIDINEIRILPEDINTADHIEQLENRLILSNTKGRQFDFCQFQSYASRIASNFIISQVSADSLEVDSSTGLFISGNSKSPSTYWDKVGYMGDEIYAFGIVYVFDDGYESPVYHIPGRPKDKYWNGHSCNTCIDDALVTQYCIEVVESDASGICGVPGSITSWEITYDVGGITKTVNHDVPVPTLLPRIILCEDTPITNVTLSTTNDGCTSTINLGGTVPGTGLVEREYEPCSIDSKLITSYNDDMAHLFRTPADFTPIETWRVYNTANLVTGEKEGTMSYWEAENNNYSPVIDCNSSEYWGEDFCGNPLVNTPIRHHKFPTRNLVPHIDTSIVRRYQRTLYINAIPTTDNFGTNDFLTLTVSYTVDGVADSSNIVFFPADVIPDGGGFETIRRLVVTVTMNSPVGLGTATFSGTAVTSGVFPDNGTNLTEDLSPISGAAEITNSSAITANILGIKFSNIDYPHPDIVGHYIVRADRDEFNRTVLDKGITNSMHETTQKGNDFSAFSYFAGGPATSNTSTMVIDETKRGDSNYLFTPNGLFLNNYPGGTHIVEENRFRIVSREAYGNLTSPEEFDTLSEFAPTDGGSAVFGKGYATIISTRNLKYSGLQNSTLRIRAITNNIVLDALNRDSSFNPGKITYNLSHTNKVQVVELSNALHTGTTADLIYGSVKVNRDIHPSLFTTKYYRTHNCVLDNVNPNEIYGGDTFIVPMELGNTAFYAFNDSIWDSVLLIGAIVIAVVATVFTAGAAAPGIAAAIGGLVGTTVAVTAVQTGIVVAAIVAGAIGVTAETINAIVQAYRESGLQQLMGEDLDVRSYSFSTKNFQEYANEFTSGIYVESELNLGMRQDHTIYNPGQFYREQGDIRAYFRDKIMVFDEEEEVRRKQYTHRGLVIPEVYHYNRDFDATNRIRVYTSLPSSFDCCSQCIEAFPQRTYYSQQSFQEESVDNYRAFLPNNYRDLEGEYGEITNIFRKSNNLYLHTSNALWRLPQNIQERVTGDIVTFLGTGDYFAIPPRLLVDDDTGSAGSIQKWATIKTDSGIYFVDDVNGDIYQLGQGFNSISNEGLRNFFKENIGSNLCKQFKNLVNMDFPNAVNPANPNGVGIHSTYDSRHERIIFTKRDFKITSSFSSNFIIQPTNEDGSLAPNQVSLDQLFYDLRTRQFAIGRGGTNNTSYEYVELDDKEYFENHSWTLSYSLLSNSWVSFHSYLPLYYIYIPNEFYSFIDNEAWQHNTKGSYQRFYDSLYPHILEYVSLSNPITTKMWEEVMLQTTARRYDADKNYMVDERFKTWNKFIAYNNRQVTGLLNLEVKDEATIDYMIDAIRDNNPETILIDRNERDWFINHFRDYRIDYTSPIWSTDWDSIKDSFPTDKVLNASTISFDKDWTQLELMRDKYLIIRLIFDKFDNVNLITNYSVEKENHSFR